MISEIVKRYNKPTVIKLDRLVLVNFYVCMDRVSFPEKWAIEGESYFMQVIKQKLCEDREEAITLKENQPTYKAIKACLQVAKYVEPHVLKHLSTLKWGPFTLDTGGISLVLQSLSTDRRLSCDIPPSGNDLSVTGIDKHMVISGCNVFSNDKEGWAKLAKWVITKNINCTHTGDLSHVQ